MAVIETKYSVGDVVYWATTITEKRARPCPDCAGTKKWKALSPAGGEYEFACPRCSASYFSQRDLSLDYHEYTPHAVPMTIGSVRVDTADSYYGTSYMCIETGVGSGSIYREADLFPTKDEALKAAAAKAAGQNATVPHIVEGFNRTLELKDYQLDSAALSLAKKAELRSRSMLYNIEELFGSIEEASDLTTAKEAVEDYKNYSMKRDLASAGIASPAAAITDIRSDLAEIDGRAA